ncbi:hypothetical protein H6G00_11820 [Leptolyngbya sp. FACHB-541]|uniref:hypothetical protein n=1 Tax=Leptolyngbya sp. FACHB-541 TaxID=2692810 RepID=UPI0016830053|nr:hypothetical protein [Leptolyngbya sp. FACHB-541]MBD1997307.1 hypothetical protein [Leptolyngbya sp. FACHB-541]
MFLPEEDAWMFCRRPDIPETQVIYDYVGQLAEQPSKDALDALFNMLWHRNGGSNYEVCTVLDKLTQMSDYKVRGLQIINRCFYTIGNPWQLDKDRHGALHEMIVRIKETPLEKGQSQTVRLMRELMREYASSEFYKVLKMQQHFLEIDASVHQQAFGSHIKDYFFIHITAGTTPDLPNSLKSSFKKQQDRKLTQLQKSLQAFDASYGKTGKKHAPNPTRLVDTELRHALFDYSPNRKNGKSYYVQANQFRAASPNFSTMGEFKAAIYELVLAPLLEANAQYGKSQFSQQMWNVMSDAQADRLPVNNTSINTLFWRLLNFLICHDLQKPGGVYLYKLVHDVGYQVVTGMLLNAVLACQMARYSLEKCFARLFHRNEETPSQRIMWLVNAFEHMNVALALNSRVAGYSV